MLFRYRHTVIHNATLAIILIRTPLYMLFATLPHLHRNATTTLRSVNHQTASPSGSRHQTQTEWKVLKSSGRKQKRRGAIMRIILCKRPSATAAEGKRGVIYREGQRPDNTFNLSHRNQSALLNYWRIFGTTFSKVKNHEIKGRSGGGPGVSKNRE